MKVRFMAIEVSSKIKGHTRKSHFFQGHIGKKLLVYIGEME
jgi:hypothetical protein